MKQGDYVRVNHYAHAEWRGKYGKIISEIEQEQLGWKPGDSDRRIAMIRIAIPADPIEDEMTQVSLYIDCLDKVTEEEYTVATVMGS